MQQLHSRSVLALAITTALAFPNLAHAEENQASYDSGVTTLDTVTVLGQAYRNTATKTALLPEETPQAISTLDSATLEIRDVKSVNEALRYVSGVNTELRGGSVKLYDTFNIRGFDVEKSYYDGLALQHLTGWNLQPQIDPVAIEQIEVFKGPTSVLYGAMSPGGMVNIIAKAPQQEQNTEVSVSTGSHNLKEASIDTTGQIGESDFNYRLIAKASERNSQISGIKETRYLIAPSVDWNVSEDTLINVNLYYQRDPSAGVNYAVPGVGTLYDNPNGGNLDQNTFLGDHNWHEMDREFLLAGYKINHNINDRWTFLQNARFMDASLKQKNIAHAENDPNKLDPSNISRYAYSTDESSQGFIIDNQLSGVITLADLEHNLLFGADYQTLKGDSRYINYGSVASIDANNPNNNQINPDKLTPASDTRYEIDSEQTGVYIQDQVRLDQLVLMAGGRFDNYKSNNSDINQNNFSYRIGALYEFANGLSPFINYATSFEPVAGKDRSGNDFKPSEGKQIEAGVKYMSNDMSKTATVSAFQIVKENALTADPNNKPGDTFQVQTGEITSKGIEFEGQIDATDNVNLLVNYTYLDMKITKDNTGLEGKTPIRTPKHSASAWATYNVYNGILAGTTAGTGVRYVGETHVDAANTNMVPGYTVVDLGMQYDLGELAPSLTGARASLTAKNLFNKEYYSCYNSMNCWVGAERTVEATVKYNF